MPMTRHRAQSSFTFEIKRANRRSPEVRTLSKPPSLRGSSLADQVFGKASERPRGPECDKIKPPAAAPPTPLLFSTSPECGRTKEPQAQPTPRRVLPDLLSIPVDPVTERIQQEAQERAAKREASREPRVKKSPHRSVARNEHTVSVPVRSLMDGITGPSIISNPVTDSAVASQASDQPVEQVRSSSTRERKALRMRAKRNERIGLPTPRLPAGQRWKRRLPKACW